MTESTPDPEEVGTITVELTVSRKFTESPEYPNYLDVSSARVLGATLTDEQVKKLVEDSGEEGLLGFENGCLDEAVEDYRKERIVNTEGAQAEA